MRTRTLLVAFVAVALGFAPGAWAAGPPSPAQLSTPTLVGTLRGDSMAGWSPAFSPDGRTLAACHGPVQGEKGHALVLWEVASQQRRAVLPPPLKTGYDYAVFTPDGRRLAACTGTRAYLLDLARERVEMEFTKENDITVVSAAVSPDGWTLAVVWPEHVALWDLSTRKRLRGLRGHTKFIFRAAFSPDGKTLATASSDETARVWDVATGRQLHLLRVRNGAVLRVAFSPCGRLLATGGNSLGIDTLCLWDTASGRLVHTWSGHESSVSPAFSPDGRLLAVGVDLTVNIDLPPQPGRVRFLDTALRRECGMLKEVPGGLSGLAFSPDGALLAIATRGRTVSLYRMPLRHTERATPAVTVPPAGARSGTATPTLPKEVEALWPVLADAGAKKAYRAVWGLAGKPEQAVALFRAHLRPVPAPDTRRLATLVANLDADTFEARERATRELDQLGDLAESALRQALEGRPGPEQRRRAQRLLNKLEGPLPPGDKLRHVRAVEVLELVGTSEARQLLQELAGGAPAARLTQEALASLRRLDKARQER